MHFNETSSVPGHPKPRPLRGGDGAGSAGVALMKALVVEDDADMLDFFRLVLGTLGYEVTPCETAEAALEAWQAAHHPLVMLDWLLAGMDGLTACRRLRSLPDGDSSVILVITARNQPGDLQAVLEAGADDYLAKPIDPNLLTVRLTIAARLVQSRTERRKARERLDETMAALEKSHDDLLYILNELRVGSALADREGRITFLSRAAQAMLGLNGIDCPGRPWAEVLPFEPEGRAALSAMVRTPAGERTRLSLHAEGREADGSEGRRSGAARRWAEGRRRRQVRWRCRRTDGAPACGSSAVSTAAAVWWRRAGATPAPPPTAPGKPSSTSWPMPTGRPRSRGLACSTHSAERARWGWRRYRAAPVTLSSWTRAAKRSTSSGGTSRR